MKAKELTISTFKETIQSGITLVDFWAPWCGPCKLQGPIIEDVAEEIGGRATIAKVNVDEYAAPAAEYGVRGIPTMILFNNGEQVETKVGAAPKSQLKQWLEQSLPA